MPREGPEPTWADVGARVADLTSDTASSALPSTLPPGRCLAGLEPVPTPGTLDEDPKWFSERIGESGGGTASGTASGLASPLPPLGCS